MRKLLLAVVLAAMVGAVLSPASARAEDIRNEQYNTLFKVLDICGWYDCHKPKCDPCKPKCEPCKPKCEPCCKQVTCTTVCEVKCEPCCPKIPCEYPDPCRRDVSEFGRNGISRRAASH